MDISDRLSEVATFYHREARKCARGRAYLAATVMQMAALEAALQAMCFLYPLEIKKTTVYQKKKFRSKRNKNFDFSMKQLINIAREASWFPQKKISWVGKRTDLAGFAHEIREIRNLVHPGVAARSKSGMMKFNKEINSVVLEVYDVAVSWLLHRVHKGLLKSMEREERRAV